MSTHKKMILLQSSDNEIFELEEAVAMESMTTIKNLIEDDCAADGSAIPLPNVSSKILRKVIEYCRRHAEAGAGLEKFDAGFLKVDQETLFGILLAANYLNMTGLLDLTCFAAADVIKEKSVEEVRRIFGITNDFTPQEERELLEEKAWTFK